MQRSTTTTTAGFTMIEILAVLAILGLLMGISVVAFKGPREQANKAATLSTMGEIEMLISRYETQFGDYPKDSFDDWTVDGKKVKRANDQNTGIESCLAQLHSKDFRSGKGMKEAALCNTDEDETGTDFHRNGVSFLHEAQDGWGNPIAYFHYSGYSRTQEYVMPESELPEQLAYAVVSEKTGVYANADSYQLISAGADNEFGTDDDIYNFDG